MRINDNNKRLTLSSPYFDDMRRDLDVALQNAVNAMLRKEINCGTVALKIDIYLNRDTIADENAPTGTREALPIEITYKVARTLQSKAETKGDVVKDREHELVQDDTKAFFIISSEEVSGQLNMFNSYDELPQPGDDDPLEDDEKEDSEE